MDRYDRIYDDVRPLLMSDDLTFGNFEVPLADSLPMSTYPLFNVHSSYLDAAIAGGFDVFSLANNHANDQGTDGVMETIAATADASGEGLVFSGLRKAISDEMKPAVIRKKGWTVLYLAVTEILNSYDGAGKLVYYVAPTEKARTQFLADLARMRKETPCDVFVLSVHSNESEYVRTVDAAKKKWFAELAASGVDIVWAHHPHVMQEWEYGNFGDNAGRERTVLFMYSMGNFVSGQRFEPNLEDPGAPREYTGDAVLLKVRLEQRHTGETRFGYDSLSVRPVPVTNWNDPRGGVVVRRFTGDFLQTLPPVWQAYYRARYELMRSYLPLLPAVDGTGILEE
jgi:Putative enzyme of poly-gamma-glutamate biosynthesis (capsule formation)